MPIIIEPHNPAWIEEFNRVKKDLEIALKDVPIVSIEHVGSTSIPDLVAKPVLDIAIIATEENMKTACDAMVNAGYTALGELGIPHRFAFRQPGYGKKDQPDGFGSEMRRNTYVSLDTCVSTRNQRDLKRILLVNEELRHEYGNVKKSLVDGGVKDVDEYCIGKTEMIMKILKIAGWREEDMDAVRDVNQ